MSNFSDSYQNRAHGVIRVSAFFRIIFHPNFISVFCRFYYSHIDENIFTVLKVVDIVVENFSIKYENAFSALYAVSTERVSSFESLPFDYAKGMVLSF